MEEDALLGMDLPVWLTSYVGTLPDKIKGEERSHPHSECSSSSSGLESSRTVLDEAFSRMSLDHYTSRSQETSIS